MDLQYYCARRTIINEFIDKILVHEPSGSGAERTAEVEVYLNYIGQFKVPEEPIMMTEEERIAAEKAAEKLRRKREYNRKYMKKIREKSKRFKEVGGRHHEQPHGGV